LQEFTRARMPLDWAHTARRETAYREVGALIDTERLATNLLASMPLTFNLLAPRGHALERASSYLVELLLPAFTGAARQLLFEHSPGRGNPKFTGDYTAFDALIRYSECHGRNGFVAFEIKYSESMREPMPELKPRYDELSTRAASLPIPVPRPSGPTRYSSSGANIFCGLLRSIARYAPYVTITIFMQRQRFPRLPEGQQTMRSENGFQRHYDGASLRSHGKCPRLSW
jgi:hypothetical protein